MASDDVNTGGDPSLAYTLEELGHAMFDIKVRIAGDEKKIQSNRFAQEAFERQQTQWNKSMDDHMTRLITAVENLGKKPPDAATQMSSATPPRGWKLPPSHTIRPVGFNQDSWPKLKMDPPRFNGDGVGLWIKKIQKFYNHTFTSLSDRLYLTEFLLDDAAEEWFEWWESNNKDRGWDDFLLDIKRRFDPDLYEDYVGRLATLRQKGSLESYLAEFEPLLRKVTHVGDDTLTSLFVAGLSAPLKHELLIRRPASLSDAISLAQQLAACHTASHTSQSSGSRSAWQHRNGKQYQKPQSPSPKQPDLVRLPNPYQKQQREAQAPSDYPVVRVSAAERADRTKRGLCWYCPEPYSRSHVCSKKFYALMGEDEEGDPEHDMEDPLDGEEAENMVISGDVFRILVIGPKLRPRSIRITGMIYEAPVSVLIDGGSTHNFIKPAVAEQLSLSLHTISPFRVFVGNGASLRCDYVSLNTPISLQGNCFDIDLFLLQVEGPDVILGVQWLQELGKVALDFRHLTMEFLWNQSRVTLTGEDKPPRQVSYNNLFSLISHDSESDLFEIVPLGPDQTGDLTPQTTIDPALTSVLKFVPFISATMNLPASFRRSDPYDTPICASKSRTVLVNGIPHEQWSVGWSSDGGVTRSWESAALLREHFPDLHLEDKVALVDGGVDRDSTLEEGVRTEEGPSPRAEQAGAQTNEPNIKTKTAKKLVPPREERPKRNAPRPSKYNDFVPR
ncbi:hypothetical protein SASPL_118597 [Salvia splendens]|uniref:Retrotransposon gag domain-containing protein n=1 Tax=Salvia splendens TaxID=180675 RepID=A0A8X8ZZ97_SALSN|nr:hypothetical protein SASPL_118597 [Salvia splendens]